MKPKDKVGVSSSLESLLKDVQEMKVEVCQAVRSVSKLNENLTDFQEQILRSIESIQNEEESPD